MAKNKQLKSLGKRIALFSRTWTIRLLKTGALIVTTSLVAFVIIKATSLPFLKTWLGLVVDTSPEWYMETYYNTVNRKGDNSVQSPNIVILDVNEQITRQDLANLLNLITTQGSPKVIGLDCTFLSSKSFDSIQTDYLVKTIARLSDTANHIPIVYSKLLHEESFIPNKFMPYQGYVDFYGFYDNTFYRNNTPHLALEMARMAGYDTQKLDANSFLVNYRRKDFNSIPIYQDYANYSDYILDEIKDNIVLIGGLNNRLDMHYVPFYVDEQTDKMAGTKIVAYTLSSILSACSPQGDRREKTLHYYSYCPWWMNFLLTILFMTIYLLVYYGIDTWQLKRSFVLLLKPVLLFIMLVVILKLSMLFTSYCFYVPDVVLFMVTTVFMGYFYDLFKRHIFPVASNIYKHSTPKC